jgi:hypothetical protein
MNEQAIQIYFFSRTLIFLLFWDANKRRGMKKRSRENKKTKNRNR